MFEQYLTALNRRRENIKAQITRILNATEDKISSVAEWKAFLELLAKAGEKFEIIKQEYYRIVEESPRGSDYESKNFMQQFWLLKLEWNEKLPSDISK